MEIEVYDVRKSRRCCASLPRSLRPFNLLKSVLLYVNQMLERALYIDPEKDSLRSRIEEQPGSAGWFVRELQKSGLVYGIGYRTLLAQGGPSRSSMNEISCPTPQRTYT